MRKGVLIVAALLMTAACASVNKSQLSANDSAQPGWEPTTVEFEQKVSDEILIEIKKDFTEVTDLGLQEFVAKLGNKLLSADVYNQPAPYRWNFTVFQSKAPEIFSLPAGEIYISTGLITQTENEAELAGVLGHEVAHVLLKHTTRRIQEIRRLNKNWNMVGGGLIGASMGYGMGKVSEDPANGVQKWAFLKPSEDQEIEADLPGLSIAIKAGYDSKYVGRFFKRTIKDQAQRTQLMKNSAHKVMTKALKD